MKNHQPSSGNNGDDLSGKDQALASGGTNRALDTEEPESPSKKSKILHTSTENVDVRPDANVAHEREAIRKLTATSEERTPSEAESVESVDQEANTQPDQHIREDERSEDECTGKRLTKEDKVPKSVMKHDIADYPC